MRPRNPMIKITNVFGKGNRNSNLERKPIGNAQRAPYSNGALAKQVKKDLSLDDIVIAVVGPVGSGKSSFINAITGLGIAVGDGFESCTSTVSNFRLSIPEMALGDLVFVDTPGFDDTSKSDADILEMVADWLRSKSTYKKNILLSGLLYFHRISDRRMLGTPLRHLQMFEKLCGRNAFRNIIFTTTMWDKVDKEMGEERERKLNATYWRSSLDRGCTTSRFLRTRESAFDIIEPLIEAANGRSSVLFQNELVDMRKRLPATSPGLELFSTMEQLVSQREDLLRRIRFEMKRSDGNKMTLEPLQEEHQKLQRNLEVTITEMRKLPLALEQRFLITTEKFLSSNLKIESLESLIVSKRLSTPNTHQSPAGSISHTPLPVANGSNVFLLEQGHTSDTDRSTPTKPEEKQSQTNHSSLSTTKEQAQDNTVSSDQTTYSTRHGSSPVGPAYVKCNRELPSPVFLLEQGPTSDTDRSKPTNPGEKRSQTNHSSLSTTTGKEQAQDSTVSSGQTTLARSIQLIADRLGLNKKPAASDTDSKLPSLPIDSYVSVSHADRLPTGAISKDPNHHIHQSPDGSTSHTPLPIANGSNIFLPLGQGPTSGMVRTDQSKPLASSIVRFPPPPSPADATGQSRTHTVLQGTINALKLVQQIIGLAPVPGLQSLVGVVLNISEAVNNMYAAEDALVELAQKAGSFMLTLVGLMEQGSPISTFSDPDSMNSVIEGLTKEMNRVLRVVNKISSQRLPKRLLLSASDKAAVDECNRQMTLACGIFGIQIAFISQIAMARMEDKLNLALKILQEPNKQLETTIAQ